MSKKSPNKPDERLDYLHPDGKAPRQPKTDEEKVNKEQADQSTELAQKLVDKSGAQHNKESAEQ